MKENFVQKVKRALEIKAGQLIPYNSHYKPVGAHADIDALKSAQGMGEGARYFEIFPPHVSAFDISASFSAVCSDYVRPPMSAQMPAAYVTVVPQARLWTDQLQSNAAVLSADNKVVGQASYQYKNGHHEADPRENLIFKQKFFHPPLQVKGTVFSMLAGYAAKDYFFHWVNDSLPKLKLLLESGLFETVDWFLVPSYAHAYQKDTLRTLGIGEERIIDASQHHHIAADEIITASDPRVAAHIPVWVYDFYRNDFLRNYTSATAYPPCVYISRRDAQFRHVTNEEEVLALAKRYGFKEYELTALPFAEQAKLFASAKVVLAPHGAGLSNLMFCREGTKVIELFAGGYVKPTFHNLSNKSGLEHQFLVFGPPSAASNTTEGVPLDIMVELPVLEAALKANVEEKRNFQRLDSESSF